jgi:formylglycine-generating enzyme required for sulfatase activity
MGMGWRLRIGLAAAWLAAGGALAAEAPTPGTVFRDCPVCPEMVVIPAGEFVMGSAAGEPQERPAHRVVLARPFALGRYETTFEEWEACVAEGGCAAVPDDHRWGRGRRPIINVTFADAVAFTAWLSARTGRRCRLPSEAEWEYAARGGTTTEYWWGDDIGENRANCRKCGSEWSGIGSAPVGSFAGNPFGLYDTSGNVWEWMADCWTANYLDAPTDGQAVERPQCGDRVIRGGSWYYFSRLSRSAYRFRNDARVMSYGIGFRVLCELP